MKKDVITGAASLLIALVYTICAFQIPSSSFKAADVEPNTFPLIIGFLWILVSLVLLVQGWLKFQKGKKVGHVEVIKVDESDLAADDMPQDPKKLVVIILMILAYIILFFPLGYLLSTAVFIFGITTYLERKKWIRNAIYAILFPIVVFLVFNDLLRVYLPMGPF